MYNLNYMSAINDLGYGIAGLNILKGLVRSGQIRVAYWPIAPPQIHPEDSDLVREAYAQQSNFDFNAPCLRVWHQFQLGERVGRGPCFVFPFFELTHFNTRELCHLSSVDGILVTGDWAADVVGSQLASYGDISNIPIYVVPLGVDTQIFTPVIAPKTNSNNPTIFLNVGKWTLNKGHDILTDAFNAAFTPSDNVQLWVMPHNPFLSVEQEKEWVNLYKNSPLGDKIQILPRVQSQREVAQIMQSADCGVFLSRGEAWNMEVLEMMACGKYVIVTDYSGHTAYCTDDNAMLVEVGEDEIEEAYDSIFFTGNNGGGEWAALGETHIEQAASHMRETHKNKQMGISLVNSNGIDTAKKLTWDNSARHIIRAIYGTK